MPRCLLTFNGTISMVESDELRGEKHPQSGEYRQARDENGHIDLSYEIPLHASFENRAARRFKAGQPPAGAEELVSTTDDFIIDLEKYSSRKVTTLDILCSRRQVSEQRHSSAILYLRDSKEETQPIHFRWM